MELLGLLAGVAAGVIVTTLLGAMATWAGDSTRHAVTRRISRR